MAEAAAGSAEPIEKLRNLESLVSSVSAPLLLYTVTVGGKDGGGAVATVPSPATVAGEELLAVAVGSGATTLADAKHAAAVSNSDTVNDDRMLIISIIIIRR